MLAAAYDRHGHSPIEIRQISKPSLHDDTCVRIKVIASSINPADWKSKEGSQATLLSFRWPRVVGFDVSGIVEAKGKKVSKFHVGDEVFGMIAGLPEKDTGT